MVNTSGQLYTMEGIAAGLIMILTAYLVLGATSVYTPGDTHITDMQLEQVGSDILKIMDTPGDLTHPSELEQIVAANDGTRFEQLFWTTYLMSGEIAAQKTTRAGSSIIANATVYYHYTDRTDPANPVAMVKGYQLRAPIIPFTGSQPGVRVTRFVKYNGWGSGIRPSGIPPDMENRPQVVLVEVFLWKA
ncbi:MAG: hypothetical protein LUQ64_03960 [Methanomicrobiales archaeon]|nr:hypothetical protein [Methanomicrobiales archaeon]